MPETRVAARRATGVDAHITVVGKRIVGQSSASIVVDDRAANADVAKLARIGAVGILLITSIGGTLYDQWMRTAPFLLIAIMGLALAIIAGVIWLRDGQKTLLRHNVKE